MYANLLLFVALFSSIIINDAFFFLTDGLSMLPALHLWYAHAVGCRWVHAVGSRYTAWSKLPPSQHGSLGFRHTALLLATTVTALVQATTVTALVQATTVTAWQATTVTAWQSSNSRQCCGLRTLSIVIWPFFFPFSHHSLSFHIILITILHHLGCSYKFHNWFHHQKQKSVVPFLFTSLGNHNVCCFALSFFFFCVCLDNTNKIVIIIHIFFIKFTTQLLLLSPQYSISQSTIIIQIITPLL